MSRPCGGLICIIFIGVTVSSTARATPGPCEERLKLLTEDIVLECPDKPNNGCTWFHVVNNVQQRFLATDNHGNANLMGNNLYSFGDFIVSTANTSQCYEVCPAYIDSICDKCSNITINEMINPLEVELCIGDDINITLTAPPIFDTYLGASLRRGQETLPCSSKCCPIPGSIVTNSATYQCKNMDTTDNGLYYGHVLISCGSNNNVEWCTPNVTVIVRNCSSTIDPTTVTTSVLSSMSEEPTAVLSSSISLSSQSSNIFLTIIATPSPTAVSPSATAVSPSSGMNNNDDNKDDEVDKDDTNVGAIAGAVVGVVVLVIIMIIVLIIIACLVTQKAKISLVGITVLFCISQWYLVRKWRKKTPKKAMQCTEME